MNDDAASSGGVRPAGPWSPGDTLLFMHISKTAGTSIRSALGKAYRSDERAWIYDPIHVRGAVKEADFTILTEARRRELRLVMGHFGYGIHTSIPGPSTYVTVLRDPVDRAISLYYHYRHHRGLRHRLRLRVWRDRGPAAEERRLIERSDLTLEDWVFERQRLQVDNGMVRLISGRRGVRFGECPDDMLTEAMDHADEHFAALLLATEMERGARMLEVIAGRPVPRVPRRNVNRRRVPLDSVDQRVRDRIAELNRLDARLLDAAQARFEETYSRLVG